MRETVTVIVPVYNVENYINKCVDSILAQTYDKLEIILVDDGSTDNCGDICDKYAERDSRIRVIHKENGGLSDARNVAIEQAKGSYLTFVDSDDYIDKDYISCLYTKLKDNNADMSVCSIKNLTQDEKPITNANSGIEIVMDRERTLFELLSGRHFSNSASAKLYKAELFKEIRFPVGRIYEDVATIYKTVFLCDKAVFCEKALYNYVHRQGSLSRKEFTPARLDAIEFCEVMVSDITAVYPDLRKIADCRCFDSYVTLLKVINKNDHFDIWSQTWKKLKVKRKTVLTYKESGTKRKIQALASYFGKIL